MTRTARSGRLLCLALLVLAPAFPLPAADRTFAVGVMADGNCRFHGPSAALVFGSLDPASARDVSAGAALTFKCTKGGSWVVTDDGGLYGLSAGAYRMRHATAAAYIPYGLTYTNATGTSQGANVEQTLSIAGLIRAGAYADAPQGPYADTVTFTVSP